MQDIIMIRFIKCFIRCANGRLVMSRSLMYAFIVKIIPGISANIIKRDHSYLDISVTKPDGRPFRVDSVI